MSRGDFIANACALKQPSEYIHHIQFPFIDSFLIKVSSRTKSNESAMVSATILVYIKNIYGLF